jgi:beta-phosphoglucomutase-like phosphatase (HAD superfamily)
MENQWAEMRSASAWSPEAFTSRVYQQYVSGKPRVSGARAALQYFHVPAVDTLVAEYAQRKQEMVSQLIAAGDFTAYPDGMRFIIAVKELGLRVAAASSSKNARVLLSRIRLDAFAQQEGISSPVVRPGLTLLDFFDVDVSGREFSRGKPYPEMFLTAARELGVEPSASVVVEDAPAGIAAAKAGKMGAVGIARAHDVDLLAAAGADVVVTSLDDIDHRALAQGQLSSSRVMEI